MTPNYGLQTAALVLRDAWRIKAGLEYRPSPHLALRGGFRYSDSRNATSAIPEYTLDFRAKRWDVGVGVGFGF